jgi:hypothetical protein
MSRRERATAVVGGDPGRQAPVVGRAGRCGWRGSACRHRGRAWRRCRTRGDARVAGYAPTWYTDGVQLVTIPCLPYLMTALLLACDGGASQPDSGSPGRSDGDRSGRPDATPGEGSTPACTTDALDSGTPAPLGALCVPVEERNAEFPGSSGETVGVERVTSCASGICLINHFQGRVTCPDGQGASGYGFDGGPGCKLPGSCAAVSVAVDPQCRTRPATDAVYCSCRCANAGGKTDDASTYCACPGTMTCVQLVASLGGDSSVDQLAGAYCVKAGAEYDGGACN